ncbi:MAG: hypothetical protein P8Y92_14070 [Halioglobus sp.]
MLGIQNSEQLATHVQRGALFETWVIIELLEAFHPQPRLPPPVGR